MPTPHSGNTLFKTAIKPRAPSTMEQQQSDPYLQKGRHKRTRELQNDSPFFNFWEDISSNFISKILTLHNRKRINRRYDPKCILRGINGVVEHNQVFQELIRHAKANKRTIHATFFDLEDAFGSVQHNLISHSLNRFDIPENISNYVLNLYSNLQQGVVFQQWSSDQFKFTKGVFQGDPLSPIVFLICFNSIIEKLKQESKFGYDLNGTKYITTPFADDFNLITTNKRTHHRLINNINSWINSMGLKLKPPKCVSISIISGKPTPVNFEINNSPINTLQSASYKFLGSHLTFQNKVKY